MKSVRMFFQITVLILLVFSSQGLAQLVDARGSDETIDIATWNLETFPLNGTTTTTIVGLMVGDLELEVIGVQEILDVDALNSAAATAGGWNALTGWEHAGGHHLGVLYKNSKVDLAGTPYNMPGNAFTRNPYVVPLAVTENGITLEFNFVVLHLKAYHSPSDIETRRLEIAALKAHIDDALLNGDQENWIIVGDFNDELDDSEESNVFLPLLEDEDYEFLSMSLVGDDDNASYPNYPTFNYPSLIDHILVTSALLDDFGETGVIETLSLDDEYSSYFTNVSDHRPVAAYFPTIGSSVGEGGFTSLPSMIQVQVWPVPSNASVTVGYTLPGLNGQMTVHDLLGRLVATQPLLNRQGRVVWNADAAPSGLYMIQVQDASGMSVQKKAVLVK